MSKVSKGWALVVGVLAAGAAFATIAFLILRPGPSPKEVEKKLISLLPPHTEFTMYECKPRDTIRFLVVVSSYGRPDGTRFEVVAYRYQDGTERVVIEANVRYGLVKLAEFAFENGRAATKKVHAATPEEGPFLDQTAGQVHAAVREAMK